MLGTPASVLRTITLFAAVIAVGCHRETATTTITDPPASPLPVSGELAVGGLSAPVRVIHDRWGIPHIKAANQTDLFFAQGFVQAQDRLFQMDLWRRAAQGRLSEVLGPNFIERDAMTRRVQYRGDREADWASYGPDVKQIADAFTRGINARIRLIGQRMPDDFRLAGWTPEWWRPEDLLNRTDAFVASGDGQDEVLRAQLVHAVGAARAAALLPGRGSLAVPNGLDVGAIDLAVADNLRRVGTPPFFTGFAVPFDAIGRASNAWAARSGEHKAPLVAADPHAPLETPSVRYLVHLEAPGWNVIGATAPWLPGVVIGHNDRVAWAMTAADLDTQDIYVERVNPANPRQVADRGRWIDMTIEKESIAVKGREPYVYERLYTSHGAVIATDSERHLAFAVRWTGFEPGGAAELAALALDRAQSTDEFVTALDRWRMPAAEFVFAGTDGRIARRIAGAAPVRESSNGMLPVPGEDRAFEWQRTITNREKGDVDPQQGFVVSANNSRARIERISERLSQANGPNIRAFEELQHDVVAWNAGRLVPLLTPLHADREDVEQARRRLLKWDRRVSADSADAALYVTWEQLLLKNLAARRLPPLLGDRYIARSTGVLVPALVNPSAVWFDGAAAPARNQLLLTTLAAAVDELGKRGSAGSITWGDLHAVTFVHPLGITARARERLSNGPFPIGGYAETVMAVPLARADRSIGPSFRAIFDAGDWDQSVATNAPGQSESAGTPHFNDLVKAWNAGEYFPLAFSESALQKVTESTLTLVPR